MHEAIKEEVAHAFFIPIFMERMIRIVKFST